ncbi:quinol monooxygenase YgiN [Pedobacter cryoconitis]|uniref:putative quinol monooxygenase n=1 Tax=Pedobacter cryoconitis TaxID=188932 RepID=UPI00161FA8E7|nr:antibiotic biosynthesis monooxygenase [Pedobacter cryoconitis]MBB6271078.1 quinol monooxygenase YgiN [Pedobacter cryoconitis]
MITYITKFQSDGAESSAALKSIFAELQNNTPLEPGCINYQVYTTENYPDLFYILEKWQSQQDFEGHLEVIRAGSYIEKASEYITEAIESVKLLEFN